MEGKKGTGEGMVQSEREKSVRVKLINVVAEDIVAVEEYEATR